MSEHNVGDMPQDFWAWADTGELIPLGICEGHCEAFDKAEQACPNATWVFSRGGMREFIEELKREVPEELK